MKTVPNRKRSVKLNKIILQILLLILVSITLITQKENILNIFTNKNKIKAGIPEDMRIGDIIKYDHKTGVDPRLLKTTIGKGTASTPGSGYYLYDSKVQEQTFDARNINTTWHIFNIDKKNDEIMIVSDNVAPFRTYGAIDYIWYEHNMHKIASIFGHGKGAKKKAFTYKVGSQLEDTGDTATWTTGTNGVLLTGARPLRTEDIEEAFGWTESTIKSNSEFGKNSGSNTGYGGIYTKNIHFPQRDIGSSTQQWADKNTAKAAKQDAKGKDGYYHRSKYNVPENTYKNILWGWNGNRAYQLGQVGLSVVSNYVGFSGGMVYLDYLSSVGNRFLNSIHDGNWYEADNANPARVVAFLSSSDIVYRKSSAFGAHQEQIWEIEEEKKTLPLPKGMQIGDIVKYDHKATGVKIEDKRLANLGDNQDLLKTTIEKGTAGTPGSTYKQDFDASKIDTTWHVWSIDRDKDEVMIVSDNVAPFKTKGTIDYIWYEHNMHQIASIFGHGKGAKKKTFEYKVGSQLEDTGDTATWKTGTNGVPLTGARPLRTEDIEKAFGWTESDIKMPDFTIYGRNFGGTTTLNISYPQRKVEGINQMWDNETIAKGPKKNVTAYNRGYSIKKSNLPEGRYRNILWDWNGNSTYQLGQVGLGVYSDWVNFRGGMVNSDILRSASSDFVFASASGRWREAGSTDPFRVVAFLSSSDIIYRKSSASGAHQEGIWDIELKSPATKNITVNVKNMTGKDIEGGEVKLSVGDANTPVLSTGKVSFTKDKDYTITKSGIVMKDNKYKMYVEGLPEGTDYKILSHYKEESGKKHKLEQDILSFGKEDVTYDILIYPKDGKYIVPVTYIDGEKDEGFSTTVNLKLMDGNTVYKELKDVILNTKVPSIEFNNVKLFNEATNELKKYTLSFEKTSTDKHKVEITTDNKIIVTYTPPQKEILVKTSLVLLDETDNMSVTLVANKADVKNTEIELNNTNGYKYSKVHPINIKNGEAITYTLDTSKINKSKYITSLEKKEDNSKIEFILTIRPVLTLPMSGSDSIKMVGITAGICVALGAIGRFKNKLIIFFKKYEIMK